MSMFCRKCVKYSSTKILLFHQDIIFLNCESFYCKTFRFLHDHNYFMSLVLESWYAQSVLFGLPVLAYVWRLACGILFGDEESRSLPSVSVSPAKCRHCPWFQACSHLLFTRCGLIRNAQVKGKNQADCSVLLGTYWPTASTLKSTSCLCKVSEGFLLFVFLPVLLITQARIITMRNCNIFYFSRCLCSGT